MYLHYYVFHVDFPFELHMSCLTNKRNSWGETWLMGEGGA